MKAFLISLVMAAVSLQTVHSLRCYTCKSETSNSKCQTPENCTDSTYCMTSVIYGGVGSLSVGVISKDCAKSCTPSNVNAYVGGSSTSCCKTDLCNISGATSVKISYLALVASVGFICSLLLAGL
ncbi:lymphocyte antigen 6E [Microcaecilia unicolor]|uniref:Lymphocyte antigen 6E-like n=1 Tax=Microcaecilia unicolor TaxID=1415580 RepID=A0A6P7X680_9AMPH|nr:lymphocyte antigen 6E-like [Microcaecilia unicolor]